MTVVPVQVALIDEAGVASLDKLTALAGALNQQFVDFQSIWHSHYHASVVAYHGQSAVRLQNGTWAISLRANIDEPDALGYHTDDNNQPYAVVDATRNTWDDVTVTVSHEFLEMIGDPFGNFMHAGPAPANWERAAHIKRVRYLREMCDPCEAFAYETGGVAVSDFITPAWYRGAHIHGARYSFLGKLDHPQHIARGGYVSWVDPSTDQWWQRFVDGGSVASDKNLGTFSRSDIASVREFTDASARAVRA